MLAFHKAWLYYSADYCKNKSEIKIKMNNDPITVSNCHHCKNVDKSGDNENAHIVF